MAGPEAAQTASMYCTMTIDSQAGLPRWRRTGIILDTGFDLRSSSLFFPNASCSNSDSTPLRPSAIPTSPRTGSPTPRCASLPPSLLRSKLLPLFLFELC
ncbi:unnamed protein product, partial [Musa acuminata var. zebrina]